MATIKTITIEYGYTFNLGNYSSVRPACTLTAELAEGDNPQIITAYLRNEARLNVEDEIDTLLMQSGRAPHFKQLKEGARPDEAF